MRIILLLMVLLFSSFVNNAEAAVVDTKKVLAIVIDDFGNNMKGTEEMLSLPIPLTVAIMPFMPTTERDAKLAHARGHEVIVHLPLEPKRGKKSWLGPGAITTDLSNEEIRKRVEEAIDNVPHAIGMNHHMGSKATEDERVMRIILEVCSERGLYYLDSKTASKSVIPKIAAELSVPYLENNMFFDHQYSSQHINKQASILVRKLENRSPLIAIGHVGITGEKVVGALKANIQAYEKNAKIVHLSELLPISLP
ncbi:divergent polysaccharide deacetylase family protein [Cytobacillus suaedae]|nr:divergent polysaccharide deacetylase family protein [Cytobacillus suaedae]